MKPPQQPDLALRGKLIRSLGSLREMLPGSFKEHAQNGAAARIGNSRVSEQFGGADGALCAFVVSSPDALAPESLRPEKPTAPSSFPNVSASRSIVTCARFSGCHNWRQISGLLDGQVVVCGIAAYPGPVALPTAIMVN